MAHSLRQREHDEELMDDPSIDADRFIGSLQGLRRVNIATGSLRILWPVVQNVARSITNRPIRILDVACGGGDNIIALSRRAKRAGLEVEIDGCDVSPMAVEHAQRQIEVASVEARIFIHDVVAQPLPDDYDLVMCSLFLHHLSEDEAAAFLSEAARTTRHTVVVHDLVRNRGGYWLAWFGTRALLCNDVCHHDGPLSVSKAFTLEEMAGLAREARLENYSLSARFPGRFLWTWTKDSAS